MTTILFRSGLRLFASLFGLLVLNTQCNASEWARDTDVVGVFFNEAHRTLQLNVISADKKDTTIMTLSPGEIGSTAIIEGEARVYTPSKSMTSGRLLSTCSVPNPTAAPGFFEKTTRTFYFRIVGETLKLVKPRDLTAAERRRLKAYKQQVQNG